MSFQQSNAPGPLTARERMFQTDNSLLPGWRRRMPNDEPISPDLTASLASALDVSETIATLLILRGIADPEEGRRFICPLLKWLPGFEQLPGLEEAAALIFKEIESGKKPVVWGDYDVDGMTGTALLLSFFQNIGVQAGYYIPRRLEGGYGLNKEGIREIAAQGYDLLITVDCGTSDVQSVALAKELGMTVVVTDHHLAGKEIPAADVLINPRLAGESSLQDLAGVGVAFYLAAAVNRVWPGKKYDVRALLDFVAMGTIADIVPLNEANRILVKNGQLILKQADRPGIKALKKVCGLADNSDVGVGSIGFGLAPRLNAAGRIGDARQGVELLVSQDDKKAGKIARELNGINDERKNEEKRILKEAQRQAEIQDNTPGIVLSGSDWHLGVIGIVASRIVEEYAKPCIVLTEHNDLLKGSARSVSGFDLYQGLSECAHLLVTFGGHKQAAGLTISKDRLEEFRTAFDRAVQSQLGSEPAPRKITVDFKLGFAEVSSSLIHELDMFQPFGVGNPRPLFVSTLLEVSGIRFVGKEKEHLFVRLSDTQAGVTLQGKLWRHGGRWRGKLQTGDQIRIAFYPSLNSYQGLVSLEVNINEILDYKKKV